jgi:glycosyltransferase involved in cell wall biosynthesis
MAPEPEISVVVASHDRPVRLRWLLNALEEQTLAPERFEVVVGHDSRGPETEELLRSHPLARAGRLRHARLPAGSAPPGRNRNAALRLARAPLVAFTDDDCRPPREWLERALAAARRHPGRVVQGATRPDPDEAIMHRAPLRYSQSIDPPSREAQACDIVYPREVLDRLGGFDEVLRTGEDTELAARAEALGCERVGAAEVVTYHAVVAEPVHRRLRAAWRWRDIPGVVRRHPWLRRRYPLGLFWSGTHAWFALAALGLAAARRRGPYAAVLAVPWAVASLPPYGHSLRGRARGLSELPLVAALHGVEMAALAAGSLRHRALLL